MFFIAGVAFNIMFVYIDIVLHIANYLFAKFLNQVTDCVSIGHAIWLTHSR